MTVRIDPETGSPMAANGAMLAETIHAAHEDGIEAALARWGATGLDRDQLETALVYCAEQRCVADGVVCSGCRLATLSRGIASLDEYVAGFREIGIAGGRFTVLGPGNRITEVASLEQLVRGWAGEEYWFWARRVLRKLRYGIRRVEELTGRAHSGEPAPTVILMEPQIAENVGMVARAMANFGLDELRVVNPRDGWPSEKARAVASGAAAIVDGAGVFTTLEAAIGDFTWVCATTARQRDLRKPVLTPEQAMSEVRRRAAGGERCAILFGRERNGLETSEVANADAIVMIPVNARFASLNLAQAVLLLGYEWLKTGGEASLGRVTTYESPIGTGLHLGADRPASKSELIGFFEHLEGELDRLGFFNPAHRRATVVRNLRSLFTRAGATEQEVRTLRGIVATLTKGKGSGRKPP